MTTIQQKVNKLKEKSGKGIFTDNGTFLNNGEPIINIPMLSEIFFGMSPGKERRVFRFTAELVNTPNSSVEYILPTKEEFFMIALDKEKIPLNEIRDILNKKLNKQINGIKQGNN